MEALQRRPRRGRASSYRRGREPESGLRETLLVQCIVSAIVLVTALAISLLPMSAGLRGGIKRALSQEGSADSLVQAADGITGKYDEMKTSIKTIFGGTEAPEPEAPAEEAAAAPESAPVTADAIEPGAMDARVDESLLQAMDADALYEENSEKKR